MYALINGTVDAVIHSEPLLLHFIVGSDRQRRRPPPAALPLLVSLSQPTDTFNKSANKPLSIPNLQASR